MSAVGDAVGFIKRAREWELQRLEAMAGKKLCETVVPQCLAPSSPAAKCDHRWDEFTEWVAKG